MSHAIENAVRSATRTGEGPLNIVFVGNEHTGFLEDLSRTLHNFFVSYSPKWSGYKPSNVNKINLNHNHLNFIDGIICNDRYAEYDFASRLSIMCNVPLIVVDHSDLAQGKQMPIFASIKQPPRDISNLKGHQLSVKCGEDLVVDDNTTFSLTAPYGFDPSMFGMAEPPKDGVESASVLIDCEIPQVVTQLKEVLAAKGIPVLTESEIFGNPYTTNSAVTYFLCCYNSPSVQLIRALGSGLKCMAFGTEPNKKLSQVVPELHIIDRVNEAIDLCSNEHGFSKVGPEKNRAFISENMGMEKFLSSWEGVFSLLSSTFYKKG